MIKTSFTTETTYSLIIDEAIDYISLWGHAVCPQGDGNYFVQWISDQTQTVNGLELIRLADEIHQNETVNEVLEKYDVCGIYSLFSGGHDSLVATHIISQHPAFSGVLHIDTGTGLPETRRFVEETCQEHDWPLTIKKPFLPFESFLVKIGFPGPAMHGLMYARLKDRPLKQFVKDIRTAANAERETKVGLISGVRTQESDRRAKIKPTYHVEKSRLWIPIISHFNAVQVGDYIEAHGLRRSPVKDKIHMSGECFCGAYSRESELFEIKFWFPRQYERILRWRKLVKLAFDNQLWEKENGFRAETSIKENALNWGGPKGAHPPEQGELFPLCHYCQNYRRN